MKPDIFPVLASAQQQQHVITVLNSECVKSVK